MTSTSSRRSLRPVFFSLLCWLVVFAIPLTREGFFDAWNNQEPPPTAGQKNGKAGPFEIVTPEAANSLQSHPHDKSVLINAARSVMPPLPDPIKLDAPKPRDNSNLQTLLNLYPNDPFILSLRLEQLMKGLQGERAVGILSRADYTKPPPPVKKLTAAQRATWNEVIALEKRGQKIAPNNTYFDWMLVYSLMELNRDDEASEALRVGSLKTGFDAYSRDDYQTRIAYQKIVHGPLLTPGQLLGVYAGLGFFSYGRIRETARHVMSAAIVDRDAGRHQRAIDNAYHLMKLSRVLRRNSYSLIDSMVGHACESISLMASRAPAAALNPKTVVVPATRPPRPGSSISSFHSYSRSLASYAKEQKRTEILPELDAEWKDMARWNAGFRIFISGGYSSYSEPQLAAYQLGVRLRTTILHTLPSILLVGTVAWLLTRRFGTFCPAPFSFWWSALVAGAALLALLIYDLGISQTNSESSLQETGLLSASDANQLLKNTPSWLLWGLAGAMVCLAVHGTTIWQSRKAGQELGFKTRLKSLFHPPEDQLDRFDFGWVFGLVARITLWGFFLASLGEYCFNKDFTGSEFHWAIPIFWIAVSLGMHFLVWWRLPGRRTALRALPDAVAGTMAAFFTVSSVLYLALALAVWPISTSFQTRFEKSIDTGELTVARQELKLN